MPVRHGHEMPPARAPRLIGDSRAGVEAVLRRWEAWLAERNPGTVWNARLHRERHQGGIAPAGSGESGRSRALEVGGAPPVLGDREKIKEVR